MTALALSLDPAGRQPRVIPGRHAAPPAPTPERARDFFPVRYERHGPWAVAASLLLHVAIAGAALAAFGSDTLGGSGGTAGDGEGSGILVELVALAPADAASAQAAAAPKDAIEAEETKEAEAPRPMTAPRELFLPPPPVDAEAIPLNIPLPQPIQKTEAEIKPVEKPKPREATREAPTPAPAKAKTPQAAPKAKPAEAASPPAQATMADTAAAHAGQSEKAGAPGTAQLGGAGGDQVAALGGTGLHVLQARFRVSPPPPPYPRRALSMHQEGLVLLRALIDEQGAAREIRLHASSGYPLLDKAALQAVGDWQFAPETVNGRPVAVWVEVPVRFQIN